MTEAKHTPLPWEYSNKMGGHYHYIVPQTRHRKPIVQIITTIETFQEDLANAELICRAVNSHDALIEALDEGMNVLADIAEEENYTEWDETIAKMSKALTAAKGES